MESDYQIGGGWGCHVSWLDVDQFNDWNGDKDTTFKVYGHHPKIPKIGQTVTGEFQTSFIQFEFVEVDRQWNPSDMFFAEVKPLKQESKDK